MFASSFGETAIRRSLSGTSAACCTSSAAPFPCTVIPSSARESRSHTARLLSMIVTSCPSAETSRAMAKPTLPPPTITIFIKAPSFSKSASGVYIVSSKRSIASGRVDGNRFPSALTAILRFAEVFGKKLNLFLTECYNVCYNDKAAKNGSIAQLVRAHALQAWGHRFESCCSHHIPSFKASHLPR